MPSVFQERAAEKQVARDKDQQDLEAGVDPMEINRRNSMFTGFDVVNAKYIGRVKLGWLSKVSTK